WVLVSDRARQFPLWAFLLTQTLGVVAFFVCSRYRVPVLPIWIVLGAGACVRMADWARARNWRPLGCALAGVLILAFASSRLPASLVTDDSNGYMALGNDAMDRGDWDRAEEYLQQGLHASQRNRQLRVSWARLLRHRGQASAERTWLEQSLELFPRHVEARVALCDLNNASGQYGASLAVALEGLKLTPDQVGLLYQAGRAHIGLGEIEPGLARFDRVMQLDPLDFAAPFAKGWVLL
ncbi:MAG: hypothetical protein KDB61_16380, partial [Planctomycetes bacterium]|nr:hypothetical protein [Planctomycetota bacterium]